MKKTASALGIAIIGLGSSLLASPAMAHSLADCGTAPTGGTLTLSDNICQLTFTIPGNFSFTTPKAVKSLAALLVGAGGGADWINNASNGQNAGYAGSGGKVTYIDLSSSTAGDTVAVVVGAGGESSNLGAAVDGGSSSLTVGANTSTAAGGGKGIWANAPSYCTLDGAFDYTGVGDGASGNSTSRAGEPCRAVLGINPAVGSVDSAGATASPLFAVFNAEFGAGGRLIGYPNALPTQVAGGGADVNISVNSTGLPAPAASAGGANGFAGFVWELPSEANTGLADTGSQFNPSVLVGMGAIAAGAVMLPRRRRR